MFEEIQPNLHVFYSPNQGSNAYVLIGKKTALIDLSTNSNASQLLSGLQAIGITPEEIELVLFTHGHADHTGCAGLFPQAEKRMHEFDAERIAIKDAGFTCSEMLGEENFPKIDSHFSEGEVIDLKPFSLRVLFTPGHTAGSVCFFDERNSLLFSGDTLFWGSCGRTDLPSGNDQQLIASLEKLSEINYSMLLPGHGLVLREDQKANLSEVLKSLKQQYI